MFVDAKKADVKVTFAGLQQQRALFSDHRTKFKTYKYTKQRYVKKSSVKSLAHFEKIEFATY